MSKRIIGKLEIKMIYIYIYIDVKTSKDEYVKLIIYLYFFVKKNNKKRIIIMWQMM